MVINDKLVQKLIGRLPDFYGEYSYDTEFVRELFDAYITAAGVLYRHAQYICNNTSIATAEVYKPTAMKSLVLEDSLYNVHDIFGPFEVATGKSWFDVSTPLSDKIEYLDSIGKYEVLTDINSPSNTEFIIDFKIRKDFSGLLGYYSPLEDYVYKDYKLYLFNQLAKPGHNTDSKTILLENIKANDHKLDHQWGIFFPSIYSMFLTRPEYRDMIASLLQFDSSIRAINEVMKSINIPNTAVIRDSYSRKNIPTALLNKFDKDLDPFDFVFKLPPEYIGALYYTEQGFRETDTVFRDYNHADLNYLYASRGGSFNDTWSGRIINIFNFISMIKPEHTNFFLEGTIDIFDIYNMIDSVGLKSSLIINDSWLEEALYGFVTYSSSPYSGSRLADTVNLVSKHTIPEVYSEILDFNTLKSKTKVYETYTSGTQSDAVSFSVVLPTINEQYDESNDSTTLTTVGNTADSYDWETEIPVTYGVAEYNVCTYGGGPMPRESTLLNLFSII